MYKLYFSPGACSLAAHVVLEHINRPYAAVRIDTKKGEQRSPEYLAINPQGRVPALETESGLVTELLAVLVFLGERHTEHHLLPFTATHRARCIAWMSYLQSTIHPYFGALWRTQRFADSADAEAIVKATAKRRLRDEFTAIDDQLRKFRWLLGNDRYICDYNFFALARWVPAIAELHKELPNVSRFIHDMAEDPAVQEVLKIEGIPLLRDRL